MTTVLAGVVGWPVSHSLSPRMHHFWLHENAIAGGYVALPVRQHDLSSVLAALRETGFKGVNLTLPHKEAAYALADIADPSASASQAANLLLFRDLQFEAHNTDVEGLALSLRESLGEKATGIGLAVVLGAGGAARAAVLACDRLGAGQICIVNRTAARTDVLVRALSASVKAKLFVAQWNGWETHAPQTRLLINATSAGLNGTASPDVPLELLPGGAAVCDLVYSPLETPLLARARAQGLTSIDGLGMLMHQGALAFELLFGMRPNVSAALRAHLEQALRNGM
jgi:shikimate dehydrogenase